MKNYIRFHIIDYGKEEEKAVRNVFKSKWLTTGRKTREFEKMFMKYSDAKYCVALNSCTAGMHLSLIVNEIKKGDKVLVPSLTFCSTVNVIIHIGAEPVFVDVKNSDFTIDLELAEKMLKKDKKIKAIMPVHYAGAVCDMDYLMKLKRKYGVKIIQDSAHCIEGKWRGKGVAYYGDSASFSFYATKNITTGEGGICAFNNSKKTELARILSLHGLSADAWKRYDTDGSPFYSVKFPGYKYNMSDIQAALGMAQLKKINKFYKIRKKLYLTYKNYLSEFDGLRFQEFDKRSSPAYHLFVVDLNTKESGIKRDDLIKEFKKEKIGYSVHFIPVHMHKFYRKHFKYSVIEKLDVTERLSRDIISLPFHTKIKENDIKRVVSCFKRVYLKR